MVYHFRLWFPHWIVLSGWKAKCFYFIFLRLDYKWEVLDPFALFFTRQTLWRWPTMVWIFVGVMDCCLTQKRFYFSAPKSNFYSQWFHMRTTSHACWHPKHVILMSHNMRDMNITVGLSYNFLPRWSLSKQWIFTVKHAKTLLVGKTFFRLATSFRAV